MDCKAAYQRESHSELEPHMCQKSCDNSKMSNKTYLIPSDPFESSFALPHCRRQLALSPECCVSASPDTYSISSLSETEDRSSPYINTECCFKECTSMCSITNSTLPQVDALCVLTSKMEETSNATPINGSQEFWNKTLSCVHGGQPQPETNQTLSGFTEDRGNEVASPDSAGMGNKLRSGESACRGSSENDCCSMSSGEMVIRSNSFCLEEQSLIAVSSLEESEFSSSASHLSLAAKSNPLSTIQPDFWEKSTEGANGNTGHPSLGVTFIQTDSVELLPEEIDIATSTSLVALPSESEGGLWKTFICGPSTDLTSAEVEQFPHLSGEFTPEHGKTFVSSVSAIEEGNDDIHTSTPVQNVGNKMPPLPSLSPCNENAIKPGLQPVKRQPASATPEQHPAAGLTPALGKVKKRETQKLPKSQLNGVKSKFLFKAPHQVVMQRPASQPKSDNKHTEGNRRKAIGMAPAKVITSSGNTADSATAKMLHDSHGQGYTRAANLGLTVKQSHGPNAVDGQAKMTASSPTHHPAESDHASTVQSSESRSETIHSTSSQVSEASAQHAACQSRASLEKSPARSGKMNPKPTLKEDVSNKIGVRAGSALREDKPSVGKVRCSSDSSSTSRPPKQKRAVLRVSTSFTVPKADRDKCPTKTGYLNCSSQNEQVNDTNRTTDNSSRVVKIISLVGEPGDSPTARAPLDDSKSRSRQRSSPRRGRGTPLPQSSGASPRRTPLSAKQKEEKAECSVSRTEGKPQFQQKKNAGSRRTQAADEPFQGVKPQLNGTRPPQTPSRPSLMGPPLTPSSRIPRKTQGLPRDLPECSGPSELNLTPVSGRTSYKPTQLKSDVLKAKLISTPGRNSGPALTATCKPSPCTNRASHSTVSTLKRTTYGRTVGPPLVGSVDKTKPKAGSCQQKPQQQSFPPSQAFGSQHGVQSSVPQGEKNDHNVHQLKRLLTASDRRFQAVAVVLQQVLAERDEATRQCRALSEELVNLQGDLASSVHSSECLEKEKEELRVALQDATHRLQEQHLKELAELEQRLQTSYKAEWDKVHLTCLEEANKCKALMQQQMDDLKANHDAMKLKLESSQEEQLQSVKQQYEMSLEELRKVHTQELQRFDKTSKDAESALCREIQELTVENNMLIEKLAAEENRRRELAENTQKDSQTLYLEQELESLKVVLDLKNKQLHQQEKKLMEINKLTEKNVKLEETLTKVKQENEDLKARMERHAALSRQLSTEQAMLQENLQKESKVNKRLSMENEELLWKLHNGDLSSPRKTSPTSPSHSFKLQSPRSSGFFSSPPVSPR